MKRELTEIERIRLQFKPLNTPYCRMCGDDENVIYSGIDAFCFGVPVERFCYDCARVILSEIIAPQVEIKDTKTGGTSA